MLSNGVWQLDVFDLINDFVAYTILIVLIGILIKELSIRKSKRELVDFLIFSIIIIFSYFVHSYKAYIEPNNNIISLMVVFGLVTIFFYNIYLIVRYRKIFDKRLLFGLIFLEFLVGTLNFVEFLGYTKLKSPNALAAATGIVLLYFFTVDFLIRTYGKYSVKE
jgi:hypothetical protein